MTSPIRARSGGPPADASKTAALPPESLPVTRNCTAVSPTRISSPRSIAHDVLSRKVTAVAPQHPLPLNVRGHAAQDFSRVVESFAKLVAGGRGGGALVVRLRGETMVDLCTGWADRAHTRPWNPETLGLSFSTTKGVASTVIHRLAERGELAYDEPVATYWPEFAAGGKDRVTVRDLLTHRAGLSSVRAVAERPEDLLDHLAMEERLAKRAVRAPTERSAYHAITYGRLVAGLARRVTGGRGLAELVRTEIAEPLGVDGLHIGVNETAREFVAQPVGSALRHLGAASRYITPAMTAVKGTRATHDALIAPGFHDLFEGSEPSIWNTEMPAVNGALSADALARMYGALANGGADGGARLLSEDTTTDLGRVQIRTADTVLGIQMRWRLGYHHAFGTGRRATKAFGHYGYGGSGGWADPDLGLSLGFVTNRIGSLTTPMADLTLYRLSRVVHDCAVRRS
jgi:CubicO group peptidase (beta-lactamase class C family)